LKERRKRHTLARYVAKIAAYTRKTTISKTTGLQEIWHSNFKVSIKRIDTIYSLGKVGGKTAPSKKKSTEKGCLSLLTGCANKSVGSYEVSCPVISLKGKNRKDMRNVDLIWYELVKDD
jgi:hypothetical protein